MLEQAHDGMGAFIFSNIGVKPGFGNILGEMSIRIRTLHIVDAQGWFLLFVLSQQALAHVVENSGMARPHETNMYVLPWVWVFFVVVRLGSFNTASGPWFQRKVYV
jgi:hypothetical protein